MPPSEGFLPPTQEQTIAYLEAEVLRSRSERDALADALEEYRADHDEEPRPEAETEGCCCQRCVAARKALQAIGR
jgi:hypothetical protein